MKCIKFVALVWSLAGEASITVFVVVLGLRNFPLGFLSTQKSKRFISESKWV